MVVLMLEVFTRGDSLSLLLLFNLLPLNVFIFLFFFLIWHNKELIAYSQ